MKRIFYTFNALLLSISLCAQTQLQTSAQFGAPSQQTDTQIGLQYPLPNLQINPINWEESRKLSQMLDPYMANLEIELPPVSDIPDYRRNKMIVDANLLQDILLHKTYISELSLQDAQDLAYYFAFADSSVDLVDLLFKRMERTPLEDEKLLSFYAMAASSLSHNCRFRTQGERLSVRDRAIQEVEKASLNHMSAKYAIWPARVLLMLSAYASEYDWPCVMDEAGHLRLENSLKRMINNYNWLQYYETDYVMTGVKKKKLWHPSNQTTMLSLFSQANNFFASKDEDSTLESFTKTGGMNPIIRWAQTGDMETAAQLRFANDGEVFYFNHPTPGTDGKGNYVDSDNGHRHQVLSFLVEALCVSYATRPSKEASKLIEEFTRSYFATDSDGHFTKYLYVPLISMRTGRELFENAFLEGWGPNEQALQSELYAKIKKGYPASVVCTTVQGICEVTAEWTGLGLLFETLGIGVKAGVKVVGKRLMRVMPIRMMLDIAVVDLGARRVLQFSKAGIGKFLSRFGWKQMAAAGAVGVGVTADKPLQRRPAR
ncbi:MAG: hypothetical protein IKN49_01925 [Elusimicrobiaceae bacterium]|nr:hypothetical protein [Elusimicrobiaceae bacterium]